MTAQKSRPAKAANPIEIETNSTRYPARIQLSDTAEAYIAGLAVDLMLADIGLEQLPDSLMEFYTYAHEAGRASRQDRVDRLTWERDLWYFVANNKGKRPGDFRIHLTNELWNQGVA